MKHEHKWKMFKRKLFYKGEERMMENKFDKVTKMRCPNCNKRTVTIVKGYGYFKCLGCGEVWE